MKKSIERVTIIAVLLLLFVFSPMLQTSKENTINFGFIKVEASTTQANKSNIKLNKTSIILIRGKAFTLKVQGTKKAVKLSTSNSKIATVNKKGVVTGKNKGVAVITAKVAGKKLKCKVTVETPKISATKLSLYELKSKTLKVTGTKQKIKWSSSNAKIATVTQKGVVSAKKVGKVTISATVGGAKKYNCKLTVLEQKAPQFTLNVKYGSDYYYYSAYTIFDITNKDAENLYVSTMVMYENVDLYSSVSGKLLTPNTMGYANAETEFETLKKFEGTDFIKLGSKENDIISYETDTFYVFDRTDSVIEFSIIKGNKMYWYKYDCLLDQVKLTSKRNVNY